MQILIKVLINVHSLVNELCEHQNAQCNDKNSLGSLFFDTENLRYSLRLQEQFSRHV